MELGRWRVTTLERAAERSGVLISQAGGDAPPLSELLSNNQGLCDAGSLGLQSSFLELGTSFSRCWLLQHLCLVH